MCTKLSGLLCLAILTVPTVQAGVILEKVQTPGFVLPAYAITKTCAINGAGRMVQTYQVADVSSAKTIQLKLGGPLDELIDLAAKGTLTQSSIPVDVPTTGYYAYQPTKGKPRKVVLFESNGGSGVQTDNSAEEAMILRNFIDLNCGDPIQ